MKRVLMMAAALTLAAPVFAQNAAVVNGKAIPSSRVDQFVKLLTKQGQPDSPQLREQIREELINREIFLQEADKRGIAKQPEVQAEIDLTRQSVLIRGLFNDFLAKNQVSRRTSRPSTTASRAPRATRNTRPATSWSKARPRPRTSSPS